jgi:hypothetical protein
LGSIFDSRRSRRRESRCLAASDVRLHPSLGGGNRLIFYESGPGIRALRLADAPAEEGRRLPRLGSDCRQCDPMALALLPEVSASRRASVSRVARV